MPPKSKKQCSWKSEDGQSCSNSRVRIECGRSMCRSHCLSRGGCRAPQHFMNDATSVPMKGAPLSADHATVAASSALSQSRSPVSSACTPPLSIASSQSHSATPPTVPASSSTSVIPSALPSTTLESSTPHIARLPSNLRSPSSSSALPPPPAEGIHPVDSSTPALLLPSLPPTAVARHVSHMSSVFAPHHNEEQQAAAAKRRANSENMSRQQKVLNEVMFHVWAKVR